MTADTALFHVPVGRSKRVFVKLCDIGFAKVKQFSAKVQYRKAEGRPSSGDLWHILQGDEVKRRPYIFARFMDPATGKTKRPELGRWLLGTELPVFHLNGNLTDFTLENLEARETERQKIRRERAYPNRLAREKKKAKAQARRLARKPTKPDGLTPEQQFEAMFDKDFNASLVRIAGAILRDDFRRGTKDKPTDEKRGEEVVAMVLADRAEYVRNGNVKNVRAYLATAVRTQASVEMGRKIAGLGHVRRPNRETTTLTETVERYENEAA